MFENYYQKQVDDWIAQYKISYWDPLSILARLTEETGELTEALESKNPEKIGEELADIVFTSCCFANSRKLDMDKSIRAVLYSVKKQKYLDGFLPYVKKKDSNMSLTELYKTLGWFAREVNDRWGGRVKKSTEDTISLSKGIGKIIVHTLEITKFYDISLDKCFKNVMLKYGYRDFDRYERV